MMLHGGRIEFLDYLRGIACLFVVWAHMYIVGINDPNTVRIWVPALSDFMFAQGSPSTNIHGLINLWMVLKLGVSSGGLGVAIFFLISGFVILMSVDRLKPSTFLNRRFFRIIPLNAAVVVMTAAILKAASNIYGTDINITISDIISSTFVVNYWTSDFAVMPVLWTLEAEMFFYLFMAASSLLLGRLGFVHLLALSAGCVLAASLLYSLENQNATHFAVLFVHVSFMLVGSAIYRTMETQKLIRGLLTASAALALSGAAFWILSDVHMGYTFLTGVVALTVFAAATISGMRSSLFRPLRFFGKISYPLYLVHVPVGWWLMWIIGQTTGLGMYTSTTLALVAVVLISWLLHEAIEKPVQNFSKGRRPANAPPVPIAS